MEEENRSDEDNTQQFLDYLNTNFEKVGQFMTESTKVHKDALQDIFSIHKRLKILEFVALVESLIILYVLIH